MKINLKKKLAPCTIDTIDDDEYLKAQSKLLKSIVYPEDDNELGNINEEPNYHPDDEPNDNYDEDDPLDIVKGNFLDKHQQGY